MRQDIAVKPYLKMVYGLMLIVASAALAIGDNMILNMVLFAGYFLLIEHIYSWAVFSAKDLMGHEWLGLALVIIGIFYYQAWWAFLPLVLGVLLVLDFETPFRNELKLLGGQNG